MIFRDKSKGKGNLKEKRTQAGKGVQKGKVTTMSGVIFRGITNGSCSGE